MSPQNEGERGKSHWKFNNFLPDDNNFIECLRQTIQVYLLEVKEFEEKLLTAASNDQLINDYNKCKEELESLYDYIREVSFFTGKGGLLKIGGIRYFFLDQKGDQKIFSNKKGGITYIF